MKKFDLLFFLIIWIFYIALFEVNNYMRSHLVEKSLTGKKSFESTNEITTAKISITITYDNNPYTEKLITAWGFSCLIKGSQKTVLFDTGGNGSTLLANMKRLDINPEEIDIIVLSHIHGDHVGGLERFVERNKKVSVYLPKSFPGKFTENLRSSGIKIIEVHEASRICDGVYTTGELGEAIREQSLIVHTTEGIIVITGCAHPGIVEILKRAKDLTKDDILLAMGGFHLGGTSKADLEKTVLSFRKLGVKYVGPCHCSGDLTRQMFKEEYGDGYIQLGVGKAVKF
jgi:7,8-dihydropterin-6-yl-methyl-4-(beta-D-ribofuranosyl)aminobenzene 5'-phosphate synthase